MQRPQLHYLIGLARKMARPVGEIMAWSQEEVLLQMAFDLTQDTEFVKQCKIEAVLNLPPEERVKRDKALLMRKDEP